ncbi:hypothetical protein HZS_3962 [Henneguya salminicola]|nr:hypothetical protein HZS_3962 [Henneguya salminicola]
MDESRGEINRSFTIYFHLIWAFLYFILSCKILNATGNTRLFSMLLTQILAVIIFTIVLYFQSFISNVLFLV